MSYVGQPISRVTLGVACLHGDLMPKDSAVFVDLINSGIHLRADVRSDED